MEDVEIKISNEDIDSWFVNMEMPSASLVTFEPVVEDKPAETDVPQTSASIENNNIGNTEVAVDIEPKESNALQDTLGQNGMDIPKSGGNSNAVPKVDGDQTLTNGSKTSENMAVQKEGAKVDEKQAVTSESQDSAKVISAPETKKVEIVIESAADGVKGNESSVIQAKPADETNTDEGNKVETVDNLPSSANGDKETSAAEETKGTVDAESKVDTETKEGQKMQDVEDTGIKQLSDDPKQDNPSTDKDSPQQKQKLRYCCIWTTLVIIIGVTVAVIALVVLFRRGPCLYTTTTEPELETKATTTPFTSTAAISQRTTFGILGTTIEETRVEARDSYYYEYESAEETGSTEGGETTPNIAATISTQSTAARTAISPVTQTKSNGDKKELVTPEVVTTNAKADGQTKQSVAPEIETSTVN